MIAEQDLQKIAGMLELTGRLVGGHGSRALAVTATWRPGPRSAGLSGMPGKGARSDPTAALSRPPVEERSHEELVSLIERMDRDAAAVRLLLARACPGPVEAALAKHVGQRREAAAEETAEDVARAGWCRSCWRGGELVSVALRPNGVRYYRDYCLWCGGFKAAHKMEPPLELLKVHFRGGRLHQKEVTAAVAAAKAKKKK